MHKQFQKSVITFFLAGILLAGCNAGTDEPVQVTEPAKTVEPESPAKAVGEVEAEECVLTPPKQPVACTMQYDPVCGCDGKTYGNACMASGAGVPHSKPGACEEDGNT